MSFLLQATYFANKHVRQNTVKKIKTSPVERFPDLFDRDGTIRSDMEWVAKRLLEGPF